MSIEHEAIVNTATNRFLHGPGYNVADTDAMNALAGMQEGDLCWIQPPTSLYYVYTNGAWVALSSVIDGTYTGDLEITGNLNVSSATSNTSIVAGGVVSPNATPAQVNGDSGDFLWAKPFNGASFRQIVIVFEAYEKSGGYTLNFGLAFSKTPVIIYNDTSQDFTVGTGTVIIPDATITGTLIIAGF